jgi:hypothetical protein
MIGILNWLILLRRCMLTLKVRFHRSTMHFIEPFLVHQDLSLERLFSVGLHQGLSLGRMESSTHSRRFRNVLRILHISLLLLGLELLLANHLPANASSMIFHLDLLLLGHFVVPGFIPAMLATCCGFCSSLVSGA